MVAFIDLYLPASWMRAPERVCLAATPYRTRTSPPTRRRARQSSR